MKLTTLRFQNFGSFEGQHTFQLDGRGLCIVLGDNRDEPRMNSNGAGKSTLIDALDWCLFGKVPRGDHVDSVINERVGKDCEVEVELEDGDNHYLVRRWRKVGKTSGVLLIVNGEEKTALDDKETQSLIERHLGLDREVFHAAVLFGQFDLLRFADAKDSERMGILTKILQLEILDEWAERAKEARAAITSGIQQGGIQQSKLTGRLDTLRSQDFTVQMKQWGDQRAQRLREATEVLNKHLADIETWKPIANQDDRIRQLEQELLAVTPPALDLSGFENQLRTLGADRDRAKLDLGRATNEGQRLANRREKVAASQGDCSECGRPYTEEHIADELAKIDPAIDQQRALWSQANDAVKRIEASIENIQGQRDHHRMAHHEADKGRIQLEGMLRELHGKVAEAKAYITKASNYVETQLRPAMEKTRTEENPFLNSQENLERDIAAATAELAEVEKGIETQREAAAYLDFWVEGFSQRGLKSYIMDTRLGEMTDAANQWVHLLTGGTIWVRFETQTKGRSTGKLSNKTNIRVFRHNRDGTISERNYRSWSGGEKHRVSLGIDFGLSRLIANRASKSYDCLILDELFKHLDQAGREAVVDMLRALRHEKSSVIVVDHDAEFQEAFENRVTVVKEHGRSRIEESHEEKPQEADGDSPAQAGAVPVPGGQLATG